MSGSRQVRIHHLLAGIGRNPEAVPGMPKRLVLEQIASDSHLSLSSPAAEM